MFALIIHCALSCALAFAEPNSVTNTSINPSCLKPVRVWHYDNPPNNLLLSPIVKEYPDISERWGLKPCPSKLKYIEIKNGDRVQLPHFEGGQWEASEGQVEQDIWSSERKNKPRIGWLRYTIDDAAPFYILYGISAPANIPVMTTPNTNVHVNIEEEQFGPETSDLTGQANLQVFIPPSASFAEITLKNQEGSTTKSEIRLQPIRLVLPTWQTSPDGPYLDVISFDPHSKQALPISCESAVVIQSNYRAIVIPNGNSQTINCSVYGKSIALPDEPNDIHPMSLDLKTFPRIMNADRPEAKIQVQAFDNNRVPLDPVGLRLHADIGQVEMGIVDSSLIASYDGSSARLLGGDTILATWDPTPSTRPPYALYCSSFRVLLDRKLKCQLKDREGYPIPNTIVHFRAEQKLLLSSQSDELGWVSEIQVPPKTAFVSATFEDKIQRIYVQPQPQEAPPKEHALEIRQHLIITSGAVREIRIETSSPVLDLSSSRPTNVMVDLYDVLGKKVVEEEVYLSVSDGQLSTPNLNAEGTFVSKYTPSGTITDGTVRIFASTLSGAYTASTSIQIIPNRMKGGVGLSLGVFSQIQQNQKVNLRTQWINQSPFSQRVFSVLAFEWIPIESNGNKFRLQQNLVPFSAGMTYRSETGRLGTYLDGLVVMTPYRLQIQYNDLSVLDQWGMAYPGFMIASGIRYRLPTAEASTGLRFISIPFPADSIGWNQHFTGIIIEASYIWTY